MTRPGHEREADEHTARTYINRPDREVRAHRAEGNVPRLLQLQRTAGNRAVTRLLQVQRYQDKTTVSGMGSSSDASTITFGPLSGSVHLVGPAGPIDFTRGMYIGFGSGRIESLTLPEGVTGGRVEFSGMISANVENVLFNDHPFTTFESIAPFTVSGTSITFGAAITDTESHNSGGVASLGVGSGVMPRGGYVAFTTTMSASGSETLGGGIGIGPVSGSAPVSGSTNFAGGASRTFTVNLLLTPPQPVAGPDVDFKVGSSTLADGQEGAVSAWFRGLTPEVQNAIRNGTRSVTISGYASTTSRRRRNRDLSEQRAKVVERILRGFAGSAATINIFYFGEDSATTPDETEDATWRRATIAVQAPSGTAPVAPGPVP